MIFLARLEKYLFYFLLLTIPFQRRVILYQWGWYFNEWNSIALYATDVLLLGLLALAFWKNKFKISFRPGLDAILLSCLLIFSFISIIPATNKFLAFFQSVKLAEFFVLYLYSKYYALKLFKYRTILILLISAGAVQAAAGLAQFLIQRDLGLYLLGESLLRPDFSGVAVFYDTLGQKIMRAYGFLPHPNILAGILLAGIFSFYKLILSSKSINKLWWLAYALSFAGFLTTFSRTAIFFWAVCSSAAIIILWIRFPGSREQVKKVLAVTVIVVLAFSVLFWPQVKSRLTLSGEEEAVKLRSYYNKEALGSGSILNINWTGVGAGNFVIWLMDFDKKLPRAFYQPVHNVYLLVYSELGIFGLIFLGSFIFVSLKRKIKEALTPEKIINWGMLVSILGIAIFDHYLWTLQQGRFIWWLLFAF